MGLAASQARFLGLTARKSNVEYQGQQINQQRTALSNEIMGLYGEYSSLDVPVPPSKNDYQKIVYTLDSTREKYEIDSFSKILEGDYKDYYDVTLSYSNEIPKAYTYNAKDSVISMQKNGSEYSYLNFQFGVDSYIYDETDPEKSNIEKITGNYDNYSGLRTIMNASGATDGTYYMYMKNGIAYYTSQDDLDNTAFESVEGSMKYYGDYAFDYQGAMTNKETVLAKAALTQDDSGRLTSIQILGCDDNQALIGSAYSINSSSEADETGYEDAMNQYQYDKEVYEREIKILDQKTKKIQEEDRALELQLRQLDTEQKALSTEMESVQTVIKDTIDKIFKTFDG